MLDSARCSPGELKRSHFRITIYRTWDDWFSSDIFPHYPPLDIEIFWYFLPDVQAQKPLIASVWYRPLFWSQLKCRCTRLLWPKYTCSRLSDGDYLPSDRETSARLEKWGPAHQAGTLVFSSAAFPIPAWLIPGLVWVLGCRGQQGEKLPQVSGGLQVTQGPYYHELLNRFYPNPWVFTPFPFWFSAPPRCGRVSEWLCRAELSAVAYSWQLYCPLWFTVLYKIIRNLSVSRLSGAPAPLDWLMNEFWKDSSVTTSQLSRYQAKWCCMLCTCAEWTIRCSTFQKFWEKEQDFHVRGSCEDIA